MNFISFEYLFFLIIVWGVYVNLNKNYQNILLLVASYYFYSVWDWRFLSLILFSTVVDYSVGRVLATYHQTRIRKLAVTVSLVANLGLLGFFKYFGFFVESAAVLLDTIGLPAQLPSLQIILPVGISFYTFQTLSYTIDVYRKKLEPTNNFLDFALFVSFFPQLVAGPIERASHLLPIIQKRRIVTTDGITRGLFLILLGVMKKVTIADGLSQYVQSIYGTSASISGADITLATYAFAFQILCDFSAYTDIARGSAKLFGINLMNNFNAPFLARNPTEFWRRWHISLSTWLRDYLYIPLGGNRYGRLKTYRNMMVTMVLGGLWHGAAWNFILWGFYQGLMLGMFRFAGKIRDGFFPRNDTQIIESHPVKRFVLTSISIFLFFQLTSYGWLLFRATSFDQIVSMTNGLFAFSGWASLSASRPPLGALLGLAFLICWEIMTFYSSKATFYQVWHPAAQGFLVGIITILLIMGLNNEASTFIYFQF